MPASPPCSWALNRALPAACRCLAAALFFGAADSRLEGASKVARTSVYSHSTIVVYNTNVPESKELAFFYADCRAIPTSNIVALTCPAQETITRKEFDDTIAKPLRDAFVGNQWWQVTLDPERGILVQANRIHVMALIYGMPLKISNDIPKPDPVIDPETGKPVPAKPNPMLTSACSLDSELCVLANYNFQRAGPIKNPYHRKAVNFYQARLPGLMLAGRIDGPDPEVARRLITDAITTEQEGLWGMAYVDVAHKIQQGDDWLKASASRFEAEGIPVVLDTERARFPLNYPMRHASLYFGWYAPDVDGPFVNPGFTFRRGAVACHLHSFSARTIRSHSAAWVGPLLYRGAAAVLGNVFEPYLHLTHHFDVFNDRLLQGYTFIESAYMALPAISWMNVAVGDPLYRPFEVLNQFDATTYARDENAEFKAFRLATRRWGREDPLRLREQLLRAADKLSSGVILEGAALTALREDDHLQAQALLDQAYDTYTRPEDQLRVRLHQVQISRSTGAKAEAIRRLQDIKNRFSGLPETEAARAILTELQPPLPPLPPPPGQE